MAQEGWKLDQEQGSGCQPLEGPTYCVNNCGFFGSKATMNMCSKCYRDFVLLQARVSSDKAVVNKLWPTTTSPTDFSLATTKAVDAQAHVEEAADVRASPTFLSSSASHEPTPSRVANRCFYCNKRVGLTGFRCRCGDVFCSSHRYAEKHNCSYDYKAAGRDDIAKANPLVKADKVERI